MNARLIAYWVTTVLVSLPLFGGGLAQLTLDPQMVEGLGSMGYGAIPIQLLGFWKVLAPIALLAPGFGRVKEWAYAGIFFLLTGAAYSHAAAGHPVGEIVPPLVILSFGVASYVLRPASRTLGGPLVVAAPSGRAAAA